MYFWFSTFHNGYLALNDEFVIVGPYHSISIIRREFPDAECVIDSTT